MSQIEIIHGGARALIDTPIEKSCEVPTNLECAERALWLGLSGGIGSGKSAVTEVWQDMDASIADADVIAREIVEPGTEGLAEIIDRFGPEIAPDGFLDRAGLAAVVFSDEDALADLNAITHPRIRARAIEILESAPADSIAVYDAAILIEAKMTHMVDAVAIVVADLQERVDRLVSNRSMSEADARNRIANQMSDDDRRQHASIVLENHGTLADLDYVARKVYETLLSDR
jgi:dephospho-CoA kinase